MKNFLAVIFWVSLCAGPAVAHQGRRTPLSCPAVTAAAEAAGITFSRGGEGRPANSLVVRPAENGGQHYMVLTCQPEAEQ